LIRVILAGEGKNELGSFAVEEAFRTEPEPGVLEALLRQIRREGFQVTNAISWKDLPKLQVGIGRKGETYNVLRAYHRARKLGCDVLVFSRDRDREKFAHRVDDIEHALTQIEASEGGPAVVGGVAIEKLESWLVAVAGHHRSEEMRRPEEKLIEMGIGDKDTRAMVALVEERGLAGVPPDARSLRRWLDRARAALGADEPGQAPSRGS
jgi:hypothetical protein